MNAPHSSEPPTGEPGVYEIEVVAEITSTPRHLILVYCKHGLIHPVGEPDESGWVFDDDAIHRLRRIEHLRVQYNMNLAGIRAMHTLLQDVERLREEVRFLRGL
jgi:DNA-binding transcriptional MerR regulator